MSFEVYSIFISSGGHFVQTAVEQNHLSNYGRGPPKEQSYKVWLKSVVTGKMSFAVFLFLALAAILCSKHNDLSYFGKEPPRNNPIMFD